MSFAEKLTQVVTEELNAVRKNGLSKGYSQGYADAKNIYDKFSYIRLPFVGAGGKGPTNFGYVFGADTADENADFVPSTLKRVEIVGGERIDTEAFKNCKDLEELTLPSSIIDIRESAFFGCVKLIKNIADVNYVDNWVVGGSAIDIVIEPGTVGIASGSFAIWQGTDPSYVTIPASVRDINISAFQQCNSLLSVVFSADSQLKRIGSSAFALCTSLKVIELPSGVEEIGNWAFRSCGFSTINIPASIKSMGDAVFYDNAYLETVRVDAFVPPYIASSIFSSCPVLSRIVVPKGTLDAYKSAENWNAYAGIIEEAKE